MIIGQKKCRACGQLKPLVLFDEIAPGKYRRICRGCDERRKTNAALNNIGWDWACALHKEITMAIGFAGNSETYSKLLDPALYRALYDAQHKVCALSRVALILPEPEFINRGGTITQAIKHMPAKDRSLAPTLVRVNTLDAWRPGNVILIARFIYPFYKHCNGVAQVYDACKQITDNPDTIPSSEQLSIIRERQLYHEG